MLNKIVIGGRLVRDPVKRFTQSGSQTESFTVACERDYAPAGQQKQTDFIDCVAWNKTAEFVDKYFRKGAMVIVCGRLQLRDWTGNDGIKRRAAEINVENVYFGESKRATDTSGETYSAPDGDSYEEFEDDDEDLPF